MFAKAPGDDLASLAKQIDKVVAANADKKLAAVINFTGESTDEYQEKIAKFAEDNAIKNIALTVTADAKRFKVSDDAEVTVMHYKGKQVKFNYSSDKSGLDEKAVKAIVDGVQKIL
ncbi:MAG: hypothetical protein JJ992_08795 [Planctomycetes bacterium]|nr:hypothetical protein [Planctomycetota bacterium]